MKISLNEIRQAFDSLINQTRTREEVANWAQMCMHAGDDYNLEYDPPNEEDKIWDGIEYLMGVDLLNSDDSYLHSIKDFVDWKEKCL